MQLNPTRSAGYCLASVGIKYRTRVRKNILFCLSQQMLKVLWHVICYGPILIIMLGTTLVAFINKERMSPISCCYFFFSTKVIVLNKETFLFILIPVIN